MGSWGEERRRKRSRKRSTDLSEDLITEILQHVPVRSLLRFKCVCKLWYNQIICPNFIAMHRMNSHNHRIGRSIFCYLFSHSPTSVTISFRFNGFPVDLTVPVHEPGDFSIVGCSSGVVCLRCGDEYVMWNPATRQSRKIYCPKVNNIKNKGQFRPGFCFDPISNAFKLIQIESLLIKPNVSVYTTRDSTWREKIIDIPSQLLFRSHGGIFKFAACVKRCLYWHLRVLDVWSRSMHILCFDMIDEIFKRIKLPYLGAMDFSSLTFADYKNSLAMFAHRYDFFGGYRCYIDVWVLNDDDQSWSKKLKCKPSLVFEHALEFFTEDNVDLLVLRTKSTNSTNGMVLYDPESKRIMECPLEKRGYTSFWYCENFASLD